VGDPLAGSKYRRVGELGKGGMGDVWEVEHVELGRRFVVKVMRRELASDPRYLERFRLEAQALAALQHPNVVEVTDFGKTADDRPYFVMERLVGRTIGQELQRAGTPPLTAAVDWTIQALEGLSAAHGSGIVHRDIKPGNLFLVENPERDLRLKILDFGIAKLVDASRSSVLPSAFATEAGVFIGTPQYVSPEQGLGRPIDERSDVYGIGLVLYLLVAGRGPFDHVGKDIKLVAAHITCAPEPPSVHAARAVPPQLDAIVLKALAKDPKDRYPSARQMADALRKLLARLDTRDTGERPAVTGAEPSTRLQFASSDAADSRTVAQPMDFGDAYVAPRSLTEREATLILDDDTFRPFGDAATTHTALPVSAPSGAPRRRHGRWATLLTLIATAIVSALLGSLLLRLFFRL
jgi:eukaryotic-like serine/threonine-protein kinase